MKPHRLLLLLAFSIVLPLAAAQAQSGSAERLIQQRADNLFDQLRSEAAQDFPALLDALASNPALQPAERDAVAFELVQHMRRLRPGHVDSATLERLQRWSPQAWRGHEESPNWLVPRFNVAAAAKGLEHQWAYAEGMADGMRSGSRSLIQALELFASDPHAPYARGLRASLDVTGPDVRAKLIERCQTDAGLATELLPELWLANDDLEPLATWLTTAPSQRIAAVLARAGKQLPADRFLMLAAATQTHSDAAVRSLALARQTDAWIRIKAWPEPWARQLWTMLDDQTVAATASLQLARLGAAQQWLARPETAPVGALGSPELERIERLASALPESELKQ